MIGSSFFPFSHLGITSSINPISIIGEFPGGYMRVNIEKRARHIKELHTRINPIPTCPAFKDLLKVGCELN